MKPARLTPTSLHRISVLAVTTIVVFGLAIVSVLASALDLLSSPAALALAGIFSGAAYLLAVPALLTTLSAGKRADPTQKAELDRWLNRVILAFVAHLVACMIGLPLYLL